MTRLWRSGTSLDPALRAGLWDQVVDAYRTGAAAAGCDKGPDHLPILGADTYRHTRDHLTRPDVLPVLLDAFTRHSTHLAHQLGLLDATGPGSRTPPHPTRTVYGDGTVVRPLYRPVRPGGRGDTDGLDHHRHDGPVHGTNLVHFSVRGPDPYRRVVLAVDAVTAPGGEAATAVEVLRRLHRHDPDGPQAVVYDGAFRGTHHHTVLTELGWVPVNKVHPARKTDGRRSWRTVPLGTWTHDTPTGPCPHTLVAHNGSVHEPVADDRGTTHLGEPLARRQVRRQPLATGHWRFSLGVDVPCDQGRFTAWVSPHPPDDDTNFRRPDQLRLVPVSDPLFAGLYGLRNDAEAINSEYKRTLLFDRAAQLGAHRQLLDLLCWALLNNSLAWAHHHPGVGTPLQLPAA
jgi:hypothetical protein